MTSPILNMILNARIQADRDLSSAESLLRELVKMKDVSSGMRAALTSVVSARRRIAKTWPLAKNRRRRTSRR